MTFNDNPFVYPQTSAKPISTNYLLDEAASVEIVEKEASGSQRVITTGTAIPIVFGRYENNSGGVWVSPPAARVGLQIRDSSNSRFAFGLVISDGEIGPISDIDIYKGSFNLGALPSRDYSNAYSFMPTAGYDYSFSETITTPGIPGTPDQVDRGTQTVTINQSNGTNINTNSFSTVLTRSIDEAIDVTLTVKKTIDGSSVPFAWRISANNIVVATGSGTGSAPASYDAGRSVSWAIAIKATDPNKTGGVRCTMTGTGTRTFVSVTPGNPAIPPVYTTSGLPLFPGAGGNFINMSCLAVTAEYEANGDQRDIREQVRCFVRNGIFVKNIANNTTGSSSNFIDLAYYLLKVNQVSDELIDLQGFRDARNFLEVNRIRYNGVLATSTNLRQFFTAVAPGMMLKFVQDGGRFSFKPVLPLDSNGYFEAGSVAPAKVFTNENIIGGSYRKSYYNTQLRKPFCVLLSWREQQRQTYSTVIASEFRYNGAALDGPFETYDYSDFITDIGHASTVANYILSSRARTTHSISFSTYLDGNAIDEKLAGQLDIMDVIRVQTTNDTSLDSDQFYQINSVTEGANGQLDIEAIHFPSDSVGASLVAADVLASVPPAVPNPQPDGTDGGITPTPTPTPTEGIGILSVSPIGILYTAGMVITLTASYDGPANDVTFNWFGPTGTGAPVSTTTGPVLSWTSIGAGDAGGYTVIAVSPTAPDSGKRATAGLDYQPFYKMSGGSVTTSGDFRIHTFQTNGILTIDFAPPTGNAEYLIVGAGGPGDDDNYLGGGGGGGGGGVIYRNSALSAGTYQINVGIPGSWGSPRSAMNHSSAFGQTAYCGGDGSSQVQSQANGGSGGGRPANNNFFNQFKTGNGVGGQGNRGGTGVFGRDSSNLSIGGGGGASSPGSGGFASLESTTGGSGGQGLTSSISGSSYVYGSGGGGFASGVRGVSGGPGGSGAGRGGRRYFSNGQKEEINTPSVNYGAGGSGGGPNTSGVRGIVIVRYRYK